MDVGKLKHRLILQTPTQTQGATGEVTTTYETAATVWGSLRPMSAKEIVASNQTVEERNYQAVIRYYSSLTTEWRISNDSKTYEIIGILNYDEKDEYQILELKRIA